MSTISDLELTRLKLMTASEKVAVMHSLWHQAWKFKAAGIHAQHPDWTPAQVEERVRELFRHDAA